MNLDKIMSDRIVAAAMKYIGRPFVYESFNCVHFIDEVYRSVGIELPKLDKGGFPPSEFHLAQDEFQMMPIGHSAFFKRKASLSGRHWTHVALIVSEEELIHCSFYIGNCVTISSLKEFSEVYRLTPKPL